MHPSEPLDPAAFASFERAGWQRAAAHYPGAFGALTMQAVGPLLEAVDIARGMRLLDVATGPGYAAAAAAAAGARVVAVDFAPAMVAAARRRLPDVEVREGDAEALPFADASFDAVVMNFGLLHLARPDTALAEAHRVLVPSGRVAFTVWTTPDEAKGFGAVLNAIEQHGRLDVPLPAGPPFFRFSDPFECRRSLESAGFVDPSVRRVPMVWRVQSGDDVFDALMDGGVRTSALLRAQSQEALAAIRQAVRSTIAGASSGPVDVPMPAVLASGTRRLARRAASAPHAP